MAKKIYDIFCTENVTTHFIGIAISSSRVKVDLKVLKGKRFMDCPFWRGGTFCCLYMDEPAVVNRYPAQS